MAWINLAVAAGGAIYSAVQNKNAANKNSSAVANLQYQPIDLKALQEQARTTAEQNAANSKALEEKLSPDLASARAGSQKIVADDLKAGGALPTDVANQVTSAGIADANSAGLYGGAGPLTAANLGLTSLGLRDARLNRALQLSQATPQPVAGLDPGALASAAIADNNAKNQFDLSKSGATSKANQGQADATQGFVGAAGSLIPIAKKLYSG